MSQSNDGSDCTKISHAVLLTITPHTYGIYPCCNETYPRPDEGVEQSRCPEFGIPRIFTALETHKRLPYNENSSSVKSNNLQEPKSFLRRTPGQLRTVIPTFLQRHHSEGHIS